MVLTYVVLMAMVMWMAMPTAVATAAYVSSRCLMPRAG